MITRRGFLSFVFVGGLMAALKKKMLPVPREREAMFWEPHDPVEQKSGGQGGRDS